MKSGDVVGKVPEEIQKQLSILDMQRYEAWRKLRLISEEEFKLWRQMKRDLELSDEFRYNINNVTGEVIAARREEADEQAMRKRIAEIIAK